MTRSDVVLTVIRYLGRIALILAAGVLYLTWVLIDSGDGTKTVDATSVGAVGAVCTLLGSVLGALGALLVSTRAGDDAPPKVQIDQPPNEPVPTTDVTSED